MYVVIVHFEISPAHVEVFQDAILENAAASLNEPECHRFDVCFSENNLNCLLYELYTDRAAFDFHLNTDHFKRFNQLSVDMIKSKKLDTYILAENRYLQINR